MSLPGSRHLFWSLKSFSQWVLQEGPLGRKDWGIVLNKKIFLHQETLTCRFSPQLFSSCIKCCCQRLIQSYSCELTGLTDPHTHIVLVFFLKIYCLLYSSWHCCSDYHTLYGELASYFSKLFPVSGVGLFCFSLLCFRIGSAHRSYAGPSVPPLHVWQSESSLPVASFLLES